METTTTNMSSKEIMTYSYTNSIREQSKHLTDACFEGCSVLGLHAFSINLTSNMSLKSQHSIVLVLTVYKCDTNRPNYTF